MTIRLPSVLKVPVHVKFLFQIVRYFNRHSVDKKKKTQIPVVRILNFLNKLWEFTI